MKYVEESANSPTHCPVHAQPERNLLAATIERALRDVELKAYDARHDRSDALEWIKKRHEEEAPLWSFDWVCDQLDVDPETIRGCIKPDGSGLSEKITIKFLSRMQ